MFRIYRLINGHYCHDWIMLWSWLEWEISHLMPCLGLYLMVYGSFYSAKSILKCCQVDIYKNVIKNSMCTFGVLNSLHFSQFVIWGFHVNLIGNIKFVNIMTFWIIEDHRFPWSWSICARKKISEMCMHQENYLTAHVYVSWHSYNMD